jgi:starch synthase
MLAGRDHGDAVWDRAGGPGGVWHGRTVFDRDYSMHPPSERNGHVFHQSDNLAVESALGRAPSLGLVCPGGFRQCMVNAMRAGCS